VTQNFRPKITAAKPYVLLAMLLAAGISVATSAQEAAPSENESPAARLKSAIDRDWVARAGDFGSVEVTSPSYAMRNKQGCVIHSLFFPGYNGQPAPGDMLSEDRYFVFASGDECASVNPELFFGIEPANDVPALLDFGKRLKDGPRPGKDQIADGDLAKLSPCFAPEAMATTRIARAHSWRQEGSGRDDRYQVTLSCKALEEHGEIVALGARGQDAVTWALKAWGEVTVDLPAPAKTGDR
jgi:hypothetical protein